jgi:hypothetical protein
LAVGSLRAPARHPRRLGNRTKDDLNLNFVQILITKFDDFVKSFLTNARPCLVKTQVLTFDHKTSNRPVPGLVTLDALLNGNIKKENHAGNVKPFCQFKVFLSMVRSKRR